MNLLEYGGATLMLIVARVSGFFVAFPLFRSGMIPRSVKASLVMALSIMWMANFMSSSDVALPTFISNHAVGYTVALAREAVIGGMLGYLLGLLFLPAQIAGAYLGQEMGFSMAGMTDPSTDSVSNVFGDFLGAIATLVFLLTNSHLLIFGAIYWSFAKLPLAASLPGLSPELFTQSFADANRWGMELAAPVGAGLFLTTVITAMLMKISPQLNLFAVGIPLRLLLGLGCALLFFPDLVFLMNAMFTQKIRLIQLLGA